MNTGPAVSDCPKTENNNNLYCDYLNKITLLITCVV